MPFQINKKYYIYIGILIGFLIASTCVIAEENEKKVDSLEEKVIELAQQAAKKAQGVKLGRPKGVPGKSKLDGKEDEIQKFLDKGLNVTALAKIYGVSWTAMKNFLNKKVLRNPKIKKEAIANE